MSADPDAPARRRRSRTPARRVAWERVSPSPTRSSSPTACTASSAAWSPSTSTTSRCNAARITALIGPNGAGKTTFFNLLTGFDEPDSGRWTFDGDDVTRPVRLQAGPPGMVRTFQLTKSLSRLSVIENMKLGARSQVGERSGRACCRSLWRPQERANEARAEALLERFNLAHMRDEFAGSLSGGQRKLLEMARALMADPQPDHARRADGRGEPGADPEPPRPHQVAARRGPHRAVRRARHGRRPRHQRLGRRHGRGPGHRRGPAPTRSAPTRR